MSQIRPSPQVKEYPLIAGWRSPCSGRALTFESASCLTDGAGERWPVIENIPYLRAKSRERATEALKAIDLGDEPAALRLLLSENDDWWDEPAPPDSDLHSLLNNRHQLNLREAMNLLGYGRVGTYFAHRWSDPTFVAGLALMDAHWHEPDTAFELACGIGHYLRELDRVGVKTIGADLVFSKLWIARNWVVGSRPMLVCFDAEQPWPIELCVDLAVCHDSFYFFHDKAAVAAALRIAAAKGIVAVAHVHNAAADNLSGAASIGLKDLLPLFPGAAVYDDAELTLAGSQRRVPVAGRELETVAALSLLYSNLPDQTALMPGCAYGPLSRPTYGTMLHRNPLCNNDSISWPSPRYAQEYGPCVSWQCAKGVPDKVLMASQYEAATACRELVDLPERW